MVSVQVYSVRSCSMRLFRLVTVLFCAAVAQWSTRVLLSLVMTFICGKVTCSSRLLSLPTQSLAAFYLYQDAETNKMPDPEGKHTREAVNDRLKALKLHPLKINDYSHQKLLQHTLLNSRVKDAKLQQLIRTLHTWLYDKDGILLCEEGVDVFCFTGADSFCAKLSMKCRLSNKAPVSPVSTRRSVQEIEFPWKTEEEKQEEKKAYTRMSMYYSQITSYCKSQVIRSWCVSFPVPHYCLFFSSPVHCFHENFNPNVTNSKQTIVIEQVGVSSSGFIFFFATFSLFLRISGSGGGRLLAFSLLRREKIGAERAVAVAVVAPVQKEFEGRLQWWFWDTIVRLDPCLDDLCCEAEDQKCHKMGHWEFSEEERRCWVHVYLCQCGSTLLGH